MILTPNSSGGDWTPIWEFQEILEGTFHEIIEAGIDARSVLKTLLRLVIFL